MRHAPGSTTYCQARGVACERVAGIGADTAVLRGWFRGFALSSRRLACVQGGVAGTPGPKNQSDSASTAGEPGNLPSPNLYGDVRE